MNNRFIERLNYGNPSHIYSSGSLDNNNRIQGNLFEGGGYGLHLNGINTSSLESGMIIEDNTFKNQTYRAINLTYSNAPKIRGNKITTDYGNSSFIGFYIRYA